MRGTFDICSALGREKEESNSLVNLLRKLNVDVELRAVHIGGNQKKDFSSFLLTLFFSFRIPPVLYCGGLILRLFSLCFTGTSAF